MLLTPKYTKHSEYLGKIIYKRMAKTGTSGGMWMVDSSTYQSLAMAKAAIEFYNIRFGIKP
jgi:hypothetical protein